MATAFGLPELNGLLPQFKSGQLGAAPTLGNPQAQQQLAQQQLGALMEQYKQAQQGMERGDQLINTQFVPNSGALGAIAQIVSAGIGAKMKRKEGEKASDFAQRILQAQADEKQREADMTRASADQKLQADIAALRGGDMAEIAARGLKPIQAPQGRIEKDAQGRLLQIIGNRAFPVTMGEGGPQVRGQMPQGPAPDRESFGQPQQVVIDGKPVLVQFGNRGGQRVIQGASPTPKGAGAAQASAAKENQAISAAGMAEDAADYAAASLGISREQVDAMTPEQVRDAMRKSSRSTSGPILGRVPGVGMIANSDLEAYANSAAGKKARLNNPTGPVSNADFEIALKSVFSPQKPASVNAELVYRAMKAGQPKIQINSTTPQEQPTGEPKRIRINF